jgi:hypothetical protein
MAPFDNDPKEFDSNEASANERGAGGLPAEARSSGK